MTLAMWRLTFTLCAERAAAALVTAALALVPAIAAEQAPAPPASAAPKDDGQWTMPAKNYAATRFSELDQINGGNVANLRVEFTFSTGVNRGQEAAPLVVNNTMYIVTPYPNILFAILGPIRIVIGMKVRADQDVLVGPGGKGLPDELAVIGVERRDPAAHTKLAA